MNRTVMIGALVVLLAVLGYYQFSMVPAQRAAEEAAAAAEAEAAAAAKAAEEAAAAAANAATEAATEAAGAATEAATEAAGAATEAATEAAGAVTEAATEAAGAVTEAATEAADAAAMVWDATKLTAEEVLARIEAAPIDDAMKQTLTASYNAVKDNTAGVQTVLDQLKQAMGL
jgi:pyruvate/2-oxoglutarate dehydrogenase complex dihydrolipoamide acyltransferase (E2) component